MAKRNLLLKQKARALRLKEYSYNKISKLLSIPKSTLHYWVHDLPKSSYQLNPEFRLQHLARIRPLARRALQQERREWLKNIQNRALAEVDTFPLADIRVQKALAAVLYWAEGNKTDKSGFKFANTDPALALLFLTLLRNAFQIENEKIKIYLYLHHYHNKKRSVEFWSKTLDVPKEQFAKVFIKSRKGTKRKRRNFAGVCFIRYGRGAESLKQELLAIARSIQKRIANLKSP